MSDKKRQPPPSPPPPWLVNPPWPPEDDDDDDDEHGSSDGGSYSQTDILIIELEPVVSELVEIRALLERLLYHIEERWDVNENAVVAAVEKTKSP